MKANDVLKKLWGIKARKAEPVPKGFKDVDTLAKEWKVHRTTAREWVMQLEKAGKVRKLRLRFFDGRRIQMKYFYG
jgi:predicted transcriptional regulator